MTKTTGKGFFNKVMRHDGLSHESIRAVTLCPGIPDDSCCSNAEASSRCNVFIRGIDN